MKPVDQNPKLYMVDGHLALSFRCPSCEDFVKECKEIMGHHIVVFVGPERSKYQGKPVWKNVWQLPRHLTIQPSINAQGCPFHARITNGEVVLYR